MISNNIAAGCRFLTNLRFLGAALFLLLITILATSASAQFIGTQSNEPAAETGLEKLVEEAREEGSTVIIVRPGEQAEDPDERSNMRAARFLKARGQIKKIFESVHTIWDNTKGTLAAASPDGSWFWLFRAIGTAALGIVVGSLAARPLIQWVMGNGFPGSDAVPETAADKVGYLLTRVLFAAIPAVLFFGVGMLTAIILDSGHEPSRRIIFELVVAYTVYRFLRHGVSWNLFAGGMSKFRLVNLNDDEAVKLHRDFHVSVAICVVIIAAARFLGFTGEDQIKAGLTDVLTMDNIMFIQFCVSALVTLAFAIYLLRNWKPLRHIFAPADPSAAFYTLRSRAAGLLPLVALVYGVVALGMFVFRLALGMPAPGAIIAAPFLIFYAAVVIYGVVLIVIQALYNRRVRQFEERAAAERALNAQAAEVLDDEAGEEMVVGPSAVQFEYQPMFRGFFEKAALAIISVIALGELGRVWGVPVAAEGNAWASLLDIVLAATLCWIAYSAVRVFIDKKMEEEGGEPEEAELGGDGGGAGATRAATLLPIMRYVLVIVIFSVAIMIILSELGVDIAPIFAGAGVVGIAVGFGAQTLIRDIFSGAFFLMDDAFRKGEYVEIEGIKGTVEKISLRSFQLRHHLGALHTIPFGEIKQLTNYSRDWVLMKLPLRVTYDTDVEKVRKLVKKLGQELLTHPQVGHTFMQPLKSQGVYKMEDSAMIIRVKFMTKPGEQFVTRKVVYESIQDLFAREGIHFAHKEVTVRLADGQVDELSEEERKAVTAAARSVIDAEEEAAAQAAGGVTQSDR